MLLKEQAFLYKPELLLAVVPGYTCFITARTRQFIFSGFPELKENSLVLGKQS